MTRRVTRAIFVCSTRLHREMFDEVRMLATATGLAVVPLGDASLVGSGSEAVAVDPAAFSLAGRRRLSIAVRRRAARSLLAPDTNVVIVGNDVAPLERALVLAARDAEIPVVLLQDGLFPLWARSRGRAIAARLLHRLGVPELAPTEYGTGSAIHVGALGSAWQQGLTARGRTVAVTGNVALARTVRTVRSRGAHEWKRELGQPDGPLVTFFTSDVLRGLGSTRHELHARQIAEVSAAEESVRASGARFAIRLHPRESSSDYPDGLRAAILPSDVPLTVVIGATDLGLVTMSAVALVLAQAGRAVCRPATRDIPSEDRAGCRWLGVPIVADTRDAISRRVSVPPRRLAELILDPDAVAPATDAIVRAAVRTTVMARQAPPLE